MKKERSATIFRLDPNVLNIMDMCVEELKRSGVSSSRNSLVSNILERAIYDDSFKVIDMEGKKYSILDVRGVKEELQRQLGWYRYRLRNCFERANNITRDGVLNVSPFLSLEGMLDTMEENGLVEYYISYKKLAVALDIEADRIDIPSEIKDIVIKDLLDDLCIFRKEDELFVIDSSDASIDEDNSYYRLYMYKLDRDTLYSAERITITKYLKEVEGKIIIADLGLQLSIDGHLEDDEAITGINVETEDEALDYLASCIGVDLRKFKDKLVIKEY